VPFKDIRRVHDDPAQTNGLRSAAVDDDDRGPAMRGGFGDLVRPDRVGCQIGGLFRWMAQHHATRPQEFRRHGLKHRITSMPSVDPVEGNATEHHAIRHHLHFSKPGTADCGGVRLVLHQNRKRFGQGFGGGVSQ
jgi:hypothetical protein